ncbi:basal cell adhesion molecule [Ornithorhynchus anatinus]|uniref:Basal cell adhesion molecule (Lutheran blood group) n=1 Tax=Ornithorhynchus anatinus TaxID=9258 RepID=A0A6I8P5U4_ORNAN|nr:basal cell adhesion molecule [Ornithorhynchus anatinus]
MEPPARSPRLRPLRDPRTPGLLLLALLLGGSPGAWAEVQVTVPPLVEVMRGARATLSCTPSALGSQNNQLLEWFIMNRVGARKRVAYAQGLWPAMTGHVDQETELSGRVELDSQGGLVLPKARVSDARDFLCQVGAGTEGSAEGTVRLHVYAVPEPPEVTYNKGILSVTEGTVQEIANCLSRNANPAPNITWYRNGELLQVPTEINGERYAVPRTVREASGLLSLSSSLYLRPTKADRQATFHCAVHYPLPQGRTGKQISNPFNLTLHYPTENVRFWLDSPVTPNAWVQEGDDVHLVCKGDGSPEPEYIFSRIQGKEEQGLKNNFGGRLVLAQVQRDQGGTYRCEVLDFDSPPEVELTHNLSFRVAYIEPLKLSPVSEEVTVPLGQAVELSCSGHGEPAPKLRWIKDLVELSPGPLLSLSSVSFDSAGTYVCEASVPAVPRLNRTQTLQLLVTGKPEIKEEAVEQLKKAGESDQVWTEGDVVTLSCSARGHPEPHLSWNQPGGTPAVRAPGLGGWATSSLKLTVTAAVARDGVTCEAQNPHGVTKRLFHIRVESPAAPQAGVAVIAVAVSVGILLLVVAFFYFMQRRHRLPCSRGEKGTPPPPDPEPGCPGAKQRTEQTGLLVGAPGGGGAHSAFGEEC